jgi:mannosyltransferase OCH1-like enzyme
VIPKKLHFVWVGDESKCPHNCIDTWKKLNPDYEVRIWGNKELQDIEWVNESHMEQMWDRELNGVADMMRYEILYNEGGITLDADSICLRPLEDWLLEPSEFSCWENELVRPGLVAAGYLGSVPKSTFFGQIIEDIKAEQTVIDKMAWETVGPLRVTMAWRTTGYPLTIYPSHYFIPSHFTGQEYEGHGQKFATQLWGSTRRIYDELYKV